MKSEREKQIPSDTTYMWNIKYKTNEHNYKTDSQTQKIDLELQRGEGGKDWELGVSRGKLVYIG